MHPETGAFLSKSLKFTSDMFYTIIAFNGVLGII